MSFFNFLKKKKIDISDNFDISQQINTFTINSDSTIEDIYSKKFDNFFIGEILLLDWLDGKEIFSEAPGYFAYTYGINWNNSLASFLKHDLLRYGTPSESLQNLKVNHLKEILKKNKMKVTGKKNDLITRIVDNLSEVEYQKDVVKTWKLTNSGYEVTEKYEKIIWAHKNGSKDGVVSPATMMPFVTHKESCEEIGLFISETALKKHIRNLQYGYVYNDLNYQANIKELLGDLESALLLNIINTIFEFTGISNVSSPDHVYFFKNQVWPEHLKSSIISFQAKLSLSNEEIIERAANLYDSYQNYLNDIKLYRNKKEYLTAFTIMLAGTPREFSCLMDKWYERLPQKNKL